MPGVELVRPQVRYHRSFLAAADEFIAEGREQFAGLVDWPADATFAGIRFTREDVESPAVFADMVAFLIGQEQASSPRPRDYVAATTRWIVDGGEYLGRVSLRHELNELLLTWGGHIGYAVRPSARGRGVATEALRLMLPTCVDLGIDPVLITCDEDNIASRKVIEANGGVYEDSREGKRRYWVPATPRRGVG